jgi:dTDP-4-dehydrorhamnose reductase
MHNSNLSVLILGGSGQIGTALQRQIWPADARLHAPSRRELDITDHSAITSLFEQRMWSCVINCAAYTAVEDAESDPAGAWRVNADGPALLAAAAGQAGVPLLHLSTDYVFDGAIMTHAYRPLDPVCPINVYGKSKAAGEDAVRRVQNSRHVILRTSWVISPYGRNFVKTILHKAREQETLHVVDDQYGRPTSAADLTKAIQTIVLQLIREPDQPAVTHHFANSGRVSWYELARAVMEIAGRLGYAFTRPVLPVSTAAHRTRVRRPSNSELCTSDLTRAFSIEPRPWQPALEEIVSEILLTPR